MPTSATLESSVPGRRLFRFTARDATGRRTGFIRADSRENALAALSERRWVPLSLEEQREEPRQQHVGNPAMAAGVLRQLAVMYRSGVPLAQGLAALGRQADPRLMPVLVRLHADLQTGTSLSAAVRRRPEVFPAWCASALKAAETGGTMAETLDRLAESMERSVALRRKVIAAVTYPATVLALALLLNLTLFRWMIPAFLESFRDAEVVLPPFSLGMIALAGVAGDLRLWAVLGALALTAIVLLRRPYWRQRAWDLLERLPAFGPLARKSHQAELLRTMAAMLQAGTPMQTVLARCCETVTSTTLRARMEEVRRLVVGGHALSDAFEETGFSPMTRDMTGAAEESGDYPGMLRRVADFMAEDVDLSLASLASVIEPILVATVGLLIGLFALALFLPLYSTATAW